MSGLIWKPICVALLIVGGVAGLGWWLTARDRDRALVDLKAEQGVTASLRVAIREQNRATEVLAAAKLAADERGRQAQALAAANGKRFDAALAAAGTARATTCDEAMPTVNAILGAIK